MKQDLFEWDTEKNLLNQIKHGIAFEEAVLAFDDQNKIIKPDLTHSEGEDCYFCFGRIHDRIATVRFTYRGSVIRIYGAAYWRNGRKIYEEENGKRGKLH